MFHNYRKLVLVVLAIVASAATPATSPAVQPPAVQPMAVQPMVVQPMVVQPMVVQPSVVSTSQNHRYFVEFLAGRTARVMGPYRSHKRAHAVAHSLRQQGFSARVVQR